MELSVVSHWDAGQLERKEMPEHYGSLMQVGLQPTQHLALLHSTAIPGPSSCSACHAVLARE